VLVDAAGADECKVVESSRAERSPSRGERDPARLSRCRPDASAPTPCCVLSCERDPCCVLSRLSGEPERPPPDACPEPAAAALGARLALEPLAEARDCGPEIDDASRLAPPEAALAPPDLLGREGVSVQ